MFTSTTSESSSLTSSLEGKSIYIYSLGISSNSNSLRGINPIKIGFNLSEIWLNLLHK